MGYQFHLATEISSIQHHLLLTLYMTMTMFGVWMFQMKTWRKDSSDCMMVYWTISIEIICIMKCYFDGISSKNREVSIKLTRCNNIAMKTVQDGFDFCFSFCRMHGMVQHGMAVWCFYVDLTASIQKHKQSSIILAVYMV